MIFVFALCARTKAPLNADPSVPLTVPEITPPAAAAAEEAFRAGASGIFSRDQSSDLFCKCIHAVHRGQVWANSRESRFIIDALGPTQPMKATLPRATGLLTKREEGVVHLVAEGLTNRDISQQLNLSEHTVRNYLFRIFNKVGTGSLRH